MSARNYTITVKLKDGGSLKQLENLEKNGVGGSGGGRGGSSASAASGGFFKKLESIGTNQLFQLGAIVTGIGGLTAIMTKASGHLQATFKLWETSMMLIFRPFGDFVGLLFRPFTLAMLGIAMPFYRKGAEWFTTYGKTVGETLLALSGIGRMEQVVKIGEELGLGPTPEQKERAQEAYNKWVEFFESLNPFKLQPREGEFGLDWGPPKEKVEENKNAWDTFITDLTLGISNIPSKISAVWMQFKDTLWSWLVNIPAIINVQFTNLGLLLGEWFNGIPGLLYDVFSGLAGNIASTLSNIPQLIWDAIMSMWNNAKSSLGLPGSAGLNIERRSSLGGTPAAQRRTEIAGIADSLE